jgi:hypothetical protein
MVSFDGGPARKVDDVTGWASRHNMADMRYYGNVMTTTRWRLCVTMETLWRHALLVAYTQIGLYKKKYSHVIDVFYIFNSTVVDWTCCCLFYSLNSHQYVQGDTSIITRLQRYKRCVVSLTLILLPPPPPPLQLLPPLLLPLPLLLLFFLLPIELWPFQFALGFPYNWCPFLSIQSFRSPSFHTKFP